MDDPNLLVRARLALSRLARTHLYDDNVSLIDIGCKSVRGRVLRGVISLRVHVREKLSPYELESTGRGRATRGVPDEVEGIPTDVVECRFALRDRGAAWTRGGPTDSPRGRFDPLRGGISISRLGAAGAGTLGGVVVDKASGEPMILGNWHVLIGRWGLRGQPAIVQPARVDGGGPNDQVGHTVRDAMAQGLDAAVARIVGPRGVSTQQHRIGRVRGRSAPAIGQRLVKVGRTTDLTRGQVTGVHGMAVMRYDGLRRVVRQVVSIEPDRPGAQVSGPGDSGSLYLDEATRACVGLHFAGNDWPERALALDINAVVDALGVDFADG